MKRLLLLLFAFSGVFAAFGQKSYTLTSPDGRLRTTVAAGEALTYDLVFDGRKLLDASPLSLTLSDGRVWGPGARVLKASRTSVDAALPSPLYRSAEVRDRYNGLTLKMRGDWSVEFRAYDDGVAYRFVSRAKKPFNIVSEQAEYRFPADCAVTVPYVRDHAGNIDAQWRNSFENTYTETTLSKLDAGRLIFLPLVVDAGDGVKVCITETDLNGYPGLYLTNAGAAENGLKGIFAPCPEKLEQGGHNNLQMLVRKRKEHIAEVDAPRTFPWRVAIVGSDADLASSDLSWLLAAPSKIADTSWIRPGKVAWDWWNDWNLAGVDFRAGVNTETYKYYIDFAAAKGIEYVILDEGWAVNLKADLMQVVPEIDLPAIVEYGRQKGVGIILWAGYWAFDRDMEQVCKHYSEMGVKGFKVDFMDRDDQQMTAFNHRAAETAARYGLILDLHGTHKPAGLNRTWPNVLNFEGVHGLEQMKWSPESVDQMKYDATIPFIRQAAGPMDYTQGAMSNSQKAGYRASNSEPQSQGTRCRQLAMYVIFEAPFNMLCDSPTNYEREPECTQFIAEIPTVWDQTVALDGKVGQYAVLARRAGDDWYVGGMTDWNAREIEVDLSFLPDGDYRMTIIKDGVNADKIARDFAIESDNVDNTKKIKIRMARGGGFAMKLARVK